MGKRRSSIALIIAMGVLLVVGSTFLLVVLPNLVKPVTNLWLGNGIFRTDLALNEAARTKGLSGVTELAPDKALLMVFPTEGKWGIWMKDMKIPLDIVWLDKDKKVIYIVKSASLDGSNPKIYMPEKLAQYVIELPAGTVDKMAIGINKVALFQIDMNEVK